MRVPRGSAVFRWWRGQDAPGRVGDWSALQPAVGRPGFDSRAAQSAPVYALCLTCAAGDADFWTGAGIGVSDPDSGSIRAGFDRGWCPPAALARAAAADLGVGGGLFGRVASRGHYPGLGESGARAGDSPVRVRGQGPIYTGRCAGFPDRRRGKRLVGQPGRGSQDARQYAPARATTESALGWNRAGNPGHAVPAAVPAHLSDRGS